jgi:uncharacterized membrane protein (UPF0127 family)
VDLDEQPVLAFDSTRIRLASGTDTTILRVQLAASEDQHTLGLMERSYLAPDAGMLFTYSAEQPATAGFWMFRTRVPLDIAFLDRDGRILVIRSMEPCQSPEPRWCPSYEPSMAYWAALEVNRGYFQRHTLKVGDRVLIPPQKHAGDSPSTPGV